MINYEAIHTELSAAPKGARRNLVETYAETFGISRDTIYRNLRKIYGKKKEVKREKKVSQTLVDEIAKIKMYGIQGIGEREVSTELALQILLSKGCVEAENASVSTINRRLAESGFRDKEPIKRIESRYANQTHQLDFSRSKYFQVTKFDESKNDYLLKATTKTLAYKDDSRAFRTWIVGITDTYSRVSLARAYAATGESHIIGISMCRFAYNRERDEHPLVYLPGKIKTDNGAFIKDKSVQAMFQAFEIGKELVKPYKKRGIQKREAAWRFLWQRYELPLYIKMGEGSTIHLSDFNDLLHEAMVEACAFKHPLRERTRGEVYNNSLAFSPVPQRIIKEDMREAAFRVEERKVNQALIVSLDNKKYEAPQFALNRKIYVYKNYKGDVVGELVDEVCKPFILKPTQGFVYEGDYHRDFEPTYRQKLEKDIKAEVRLKDGGTAMVSINKQPQVQELNTKFTQAEHAADFVFPNEYKAKEYIGKQLAIMFGREINYSHYADVFDGMLKTERSKAAIDAVLAEVNNIALSM